jgi:hypothetical protein
MRQAGERFPHLSWLIAVLGFLGLIAAGYPLLKYLGKTAEETIRDQAAAGLAANLVCQHMQTHGGRWPNGWQDLQAAFARKYPDSHVRNFEEMRRRVEVDFDVDPASLARMEAEDVSTAPFSVVRLKSGRPGNVGPQANRMIYDYLKQRARRAATQTATQPATAPATPDGGS